MRRECAKRKRIRHRRSGKTAKALRKFCYLSLSVLIVLLLLPHVPFPFYKPHFLHTIFSHGLGGLISLGLVTSLFLVAGVLAGASFYQSVRVGDLPKRLLLDIFVIPIVLILILFGLNVYTHQIEPTLIYHLNKDRQIDEFVNPFLGYRMADCRDMTDAYDVIFIPSHIRIETEFVSYAPRRKDNSQGCIRCRIFGEHWYEDLSGSQWDHVLFNCAERNKPPW